LPFEEVTVRKQEQTVKPKVRKDSLDDLTESDEEDLETLKRRLLKEREEKQKQSIST
jgi:hypothetical protein